MPELKLLVQVNTLEGRPAASAGFMQLAPTAPDVHQEHLDDTQEDCEVIPSQSAAPTNTWHNATIATIKARKRPDMVGLKTLDMNL